MLYFPADADDVVEPGVPVRADNSPAPVGRKFTVVQYSISILFQLQDLMIFKYN